MSLVLTIVSLIVSLIALLAVAIEIARSRRISNADNWPIDINFSIRQSTYLKGMEQLADHFEEDRWKPEAVVGVHYGGVEHAATLARKWFIPFLFTWTRLDHDADTRKATCVGVEPRFSDREVKGKKVLVVDNQIKSGRTLRLVVEDIRGRGATDIRTVVVHRNGVADSPDHVPDYVLFRSTRRLQHLRF